MAIIAADVHPGSSFTTARLIYVAGKEGYLPALFGRHNSMLKTPLNAMCLQAVLTIFFILVGGGFRSLINFAVVASWAFYFLTVRMTVGQRVVICSCKLSIGPRTCDPTGERTDAGETVQNVDHYTIDFLRSTLPHGLILLSVRLLNLSPIVGLSISAMHADHCCAPGGHCRTRCVPTSLCHYRPPNTL